MPRPGRSKRPAPDWKGGQTTLFGAPRNQEDEKELHPREQARQERRTAKGGQAADEPNDQPSKVAKRNFQDAWFVSHVWLVIVEEGGFTKLSCGTCRRAIILRPSASINRGLGAKPTTNFKIDVLREHELSTEHMAAVQICKDADLAVSKEAVKAKERNLVELFSNGHEKEGSTKLRQLACLVHTIKQNHSIASYVALPPLMKTLQVPVADGHWSATAANDFLMVLDEVLIAELRSDIKEAIYFGLSFDDSKSIDNTEYMSVECYYVHPITCATTTAFLKMQPVTACDAESLTEHLLCVVEEVLDIKREDLHKHLVCVATDGASVNVGAHSGICQRLRDEVAPLVDNIKCYAHITQLCAKPIARDKVFADCIEVLSEAYAYCLDSPQREGALKDWQIKCGSSELKLLQVSSTRWLSLSNCLRTFLSIYGPVLNFLEEEAQKRKGNMANKAGILLERMLDINIILGMRAMYYLVEELRVLSQKMQARDLTHDAAKEALECAKSRIDQQYLDGGGSWDGSVWANSIVYDQPPCDSASFSPLCFTARENGLEVATLHYHGGFFKYHEVTSFTNKRTTDINQGQRRTTTLEQKAFTRLDIEEIEDRIADTQKRTGIVAASVLADMEARFQLNQTLEAFDLLNPSYWGPIEDGTPTDVALRKEAAKRKLAYLKQKYCTPVDMDFGLHEGTTLPPLLSAASLDLQYDSMIAAVSARAGKKSMEDFWAQVFSRLHVRQHIPDFAALAQIALSFPLTSVENERQFSLMNLVKNARRNRLGPPALNALCRIKRSSYTVETMPYDEVYKTWLGKKVRRNVNAVRKD